MKTFSQCDYVNRLERLHRLIRITICLRNYTLSTGNLGHYPTAPHALHLHNSRRSRAQKIGDSLREKNKLGPAGTRRTITYSLFFQKKRKYTFSLGSWRLFLCWHLSGLPWWHFEVTPVTRWLSAHGFRSSPGSEVLLTGPSETQM